MFLSEKVVFADFNSRLVERQIRPWTHLAKNKHALSERLSYLSEQDRYLFVFRAKDGVVDFVSKSRMTDQQRGNTKDPAIRRAHIYRKLLQTALNAHAYTGTFELAVHGGDGSAMVDPDVPIFCFQRPIGSIKLLLPDPDFINFDFSVDRYQDEIEYEDKNNTAVFAGSTTGHTGERGSSLITSNTINNFLLPRLNAFMFFKGSDKVDFRLPSIVQCLSNHEVQLLQRLGCGGDRLTFEEQIKHRFLISIDGNGPTCLRVLQALKSNSVLLKYASDDELYYTEAFKPWVHYLPVGQHSDVFKYVDMEANFPGTFKAISQQASNFVGGFLTKPAVLDYTIRLIDAYTKLSES